MLKESIMKNRFHIGMFCLLAILVSFAIYNITHVILTYFNVEQRMAETLGRFLASAVIVTFYAKVFELKRFGIKKENFLKGLVTGGFLFFVVIVNLIMTIQEAAEYPAVTPSLYLIFMVVIEQLFVGVFEEFLFRGLILNTLLEKMGSQRKGRILSIILSSVLFGLVHLLNLFENPNMINATISQVFYSAFIGIFLGALYVRAGNIWVVVVYHAMVNLAGELPVIFYDLPAGTMADETLNNVMVSILTNVVFVLVGLFLVRKRKDGDGSV